MIRKSREAAVRAGAALIVVVATVVSCGSGGGNPAPAPPPRMSRVSLATGGAQADGPSFRNAISGDGSVIAFRSEATNLSAVDNNPISDIFAHDRNSGVTTLVSVGLGGAPSDGSSYDPAIDSTGRYVAFESAGTNLVAGDGNGIADVFIRDLETMTTALISVSIGGTAGGNVSSAPSISGDGNVVAFVSFADDLALPARGYPFSDIYVRDRAAAATRRVSVATDNTPSDGTSNSPAVSRDGRFVAFESDGANLVAGDNNAARDVFVRDLVAHVTERVSVSSANAQGDDHSFRPVVSGDGRYVAFRSQASNLVPNDNNGVPDIFLRDRQAGTTEIVSVSSAGEIGDGASNHPAITDDGRYVVFKSAAANLVAGDTNAQEDVFIRDRQLGTTRRLTVGLSGEEPDGPSGECRISAGGGAVSFQSQASNLVSGDTNGADDVFVVLP